MVVKDFNRLRLYRNWDGWVKDLVFERLIRHQPSTELVSLGGMAWSCLRFRRVSRLNLQSNLSSVVPPDTGVVDEGFPVRGYVSDANDVVVHLLWAAYEGCWRSA